MRGKNRLMGLGVRERGWERDRGSFHAGIYKNQKLGGHRNGLRSVPSLCISWLKRFLVSCFYFISNLFFIEIQLIYNVFISAVWQSDSATHIHSFSYSFLLEFITGYWVLFPMQYNRTLLFIHRLCNGLHLLIPNSHSILPPSPLSWQLYICSLCLWICFIDKFIC